MTTRALTLFDTSIGMKAVMAVTGAVLFGFVIGHMLGHLLMFLGPDTYNAYAMALHNAPALLWGTRVVLLVSVAAHVASAVRVTTINQAARPARYQLRRDMATNYAARTMVWSGPILAFFILYHLAHFTLGATPGNYVHSTENVYNNMVMSFQVPWVLALYVVAVLSLGAHLFHGAWSMFNSLGANHPRYNPFLKRFALVMAVVVTVGFLSVPLAIFAGIIG
jgi:succinate dehydrogenase / fumarate reductase cytochrome b subunit